MGKRIDWTIDKLNLLPKSVGYALESGDKYFYNGNHCQKDHLCPRLTSSGKCAYCIRERQTIATRRLRQDKSRVKGEKPINHGLTRTLEYKIYHTAKIRAKVKNLQFNISVTDIKIPDNCPILGIPLSKLWGNVTQDSKNRFDKPSLDRIDSAKGYVVGNVEVLSYRANMIKGDGTIEEHLKIAAFLKKYGL
jgi:hypothetical protein